ncbi:CAP Gly-rich domain-containing protein [Mycena galericulata]|nr:CAP Gly-rich domain-containing protein [Mycena galericulata]
MPRAFADAIKANDPARHRSSDISAASLPPHTSSFAPRASSVASSSSQPAKTPATHPQSRQSVPFTRSSSRAGTRTFEVGDNVRIESLGYEGTLRYLGITDGKPGLWAGVELAGGFAGKGKNNGTVNGKQYFSCPPNCGVFVATTKLSAPTVGPGAIHRPSSVASSRGGRITPSVSGRNTPSTSIQHHNPRHDPRHPCMRPCSRQPASAGPAALTEKLTAGSRASKYVSMTTKQLSSRNAAATTPSRRTMEPASAAQTVPSPSLISRTTSSPTRPPGSPLPSLGGCVSES